jgi:hypothetical protein
MWFPVDPVVNDEVEVEEARKLYGLATNNVLPVRQGIA